MFCARPAASASAAAIAFVRFVGVTRMRWPFPFPFYGLFLQILFPFTMPTSPQGNHFALTEQITNFVIFRSFHFMSLGFVSFALAVAKGGIPEAAAAQHVYYYLCRFYCF